MSPAFDLVAHLYRQRAFSERTFGPGARTKGVLNHIRKELAEIEADPFVRSVMEAFPGAEILGVRVLPQPEAAPAGEDETDDDED